MSERLEALSSSSDSAARVELADILRGLAALGDKAASLGVPPPIELTTQPDVDQLLVQAGVFPGLATLGSAVVTCLKVLGPQDQAAPALLFPFELTALLSWPAVVLHASTVLLRCEALGATVAALILKQTSDCVGQLLLHLCGRGQRHLYGCDAMARLRQAIPPLPARPVGSYLAASQARSRRVRVGGLGVCAGVAGPPHRLSCHPASC